MYNDSSTVMMSLMYNDSSTVESHMYNDMMSLICTMIVALL